MHELFLGRKYFVATGEFITKHDCPAFEPKYDALAIGFFVSMIVKLFSRLLNSI